MSGRGGRRGLSTDGGRTWSFASERGADSLVLVDIEALGGGTACVLATSFDGGFARAYRTDDFGMTWRVVRFDPAPWLGSSGSGQQR